MKRFGCGPAMGRLPAALTTLGVVLLLGACASSSTTTMVGESDNMASEAAMMELGEWNALPAGSLDISDMNNVLRAYYDSEGDGHLMAAAPVQPAGPGTATWNGMWSGKIELNPDPLASAGLRAFGVNPDGLEELGGMAQITAYFEDGGVGAELVYRDIGVDGLRLSEITFDRVTVTRGQFEPQRMYSHSFVAMTTNPFDPAAPSTMTPTTVTGDFTGQGVFGAADAAGVVGYLDGGMNIEYGRGPTNLGVFHSVFFGTREQN